MELNYLALNKYKNNNKVLKYFVHNNNCKNMQGIKVLRLRFPKLYALDIATVSQAIKGI